MAQEILSKFRFSIDVRACDAESRAYAPPAALRGCLVLDSPGVREEAEGGGALRRSCSGALGTSWGNHGMLVDRKEL